MVPVHIFMAGYRAFQSGKKRDEWSETLLVPELVTIPNIHEWQAGWDRGEMEMKEAMWQSMTEKCPWKVDKQGHLICMATDMKCEESGCAVAFFLKRLSKA